MTAQSATDARNKRRYDAGSRAAMVDRIRLQAAGKKGGKMTGKGFLSACSTAGLNRAAASASGEIG